MKRNFALQVLALALSTFAFGQGDEIILKDSAVIFSPGVISGSSNEFTPTFHPTGKVMFFSKATANFDFISIFQSHLKNGKWTTPAAVWFTSFYRDTDPFLSKDGKKLYFMSDRPIQGRPFKNFDYSLYYCDVDEQFRLSVPKEFPLQLPPGMKALYKTMADNQNIYFFSRTGNDANIFACVFNPSTNSYNSPVALSFNDTSFNDFDPMIAHDESFIVFTSSNRKGLGGNDLWISFNKEGEWTRPVNLGPKVNTPQNDGAPRLSSDNKTLFFTSYRERIVRSDASQNKIGRIEAENIFNSYQNGNRNIYSISIREITESK